MQSTSRVLIHCALARSTSILSIILFFYYLTFWFFRPSMKTAKAPLFYLILIVSPLVGSYQQVLGQEKKVAYFATAYDFFCHFTLAEWEGHGAQNIIVYVRMLHCLLAINFRHAQPVPGGIPQLNVNKLSFLNIARSTWVLCSALCLEFSSATVRCSPYQESKWRKNGACLICLPSLLPTPEHTWGVWQITVSFFQLFVKCKLLEIRLVTSRVARGDLQAGFEKRNVPSVRRD